MCTGGGRAHPRADVSVRSKNLQDSGVTNPSTHQHTKQVLTGASKLQQGLVCPGPPHWPALLQALSFSLFSQQGLCTGRSLRPGALEPGSPSRSQLLCHLLRKALPAPSSQ